MKMVLLELSSFLAPPAAWWLFRRFARRDVTGDMLAGMIIGVFLEFATEPLWDYHFRVTIYKDVPLCVIPAWGMMFTVVTFLSEKFYTRFLRKPAVDPKDKRIFLFDLLGAVLVGLPFEAIGLKTGIWDYNYHYLQWNWGTIPFFQMPVEALVGYALLMLVAPTFVRVWQGPFEGRS